MLKRVYRDFYCIKWYIYAWTFYCCLLILLPVQGPSKNQIEASIAIIVYVLLSSTATLLFHGKLQSKTSIIQSRISSLKNTEKIKFIIKIASILSIVGFCLFAFNMIFILKINYFEGVAAARSSWRTLRTNQSTPTGILTFLTNFLWPFCYMNLALLHLHWENLHKKTKKIALYSGLITLFGTTFLKGSRGSLLFQFAMTLSVGIIRRIRYNKHFLPGSKSTRLVVIIFPVLIIFYTAYIFSLRAAHNDVSIQRYALSFIRLLGGSEKELFFKIEDLNPFIASLLYLLILIGVYLVHGFWSFQNTMDITDRPGTINFRAILYFTNRLGLTTNEDTLLEYSNWMPLPGAIWYDFDLIGLIVISLIYGILLKVALKITISGHYGGLGLCFVLSVFSTMIISPLMPITSIVDFSIMIISYVFMHLLTTAKFKNVSWF